MSGTEGIAHVRPRPEVRRDVTLTDPALLTALRVISGGNDSNRYRFVRDSGKWADQSLARYAAIPSLADPRALLDLDASPSAWRSALKPHSQGAASRKVRFVGRALGFASRFGLTATLFRDRVALLGSGGVANSPVHSFLAETIGTDRFHINFRLAPGRPNSKPVVQVVGHDGQVLAFAKFGWDSLTRRLIRSEGETLETLGERTGDGPIHVPRVLRSEDWNGLEALVLAPLVEMGKTPWNSEDEVIAAARAMSQIIPVERHRLARSPFWQELNACHEKLSVHFDRRTQEIILATLDALESRWGDEEISFGLSHGDWIPPNMSVRHDGTFNIWDWERSETQAPLGLDMLQFILFDELQRPRDLTHLREHVETRGRRALSALGLAPELAQMLGPLSLLRSIFWFGEAIEAGRAKSEGHPFTDALECLLGEIEPGLTRNVNTKPRAEWIPTAVRHQPSHSSNLKMKASTNEN